MKKLLFSLILPLFIEASIPSSSNIGGKKAVGAKGVLLCGSKPVEGVIVRLFRVPQKKQDDLNQILDEQVTNSEGHFKVHGNTNGFPIAEMSIEPTLSFYHSCDEDKEKVKKNGYRKFNYNVPSEYVISGARPRVFYDLGRLNLQLEFPEERHEKNYKKYEKQENPY